MSLTWKKLDKNLIEQIDETDSKVRERLTELTSVTLPTEKTKVSDFKVYQYQKKKTASTSISVSPFFKGDGDYESFWYRYFAGGYSDQYRITPGSNSKIEVERFGLGISLDLEITNIKSSIKGGFSSIAAAVEMKLADAQYSYSIHALPEGAFHSLLPPIGKFDFESFKQFHGLVKKLKELYKDALNTSIDLVAMEVLLSEPVKEDGVENSRSYYFAAKRIIEGLSLEGAIKKARKMPEVFNEDAIQYIYFLCGLDSIEQSPISSNISRARALIFA